MLARFPDLRFAIVESGMGWVPFILDNNPARLYGHALAAQGVSVN